VDTPGIDGGRSIRTYELAQVLGILSVVDKDIASFYLFITYLKLHEKIGSDSYLPYCLAGYNIAPTTQNLMCETIVIDMIEPDMIFRPAILLPCPDRSTDLYTIFPTPRSTRGYTQQQKLTVKSFKMIRFWAIHYVTTDRYGYEDISDPTDDQLPIVRLAPAEVARPMLSRHMDDLYENVRVGLGPNTGDVEFEDMLEFDPNEDDL
jgi:hypothetical protein